MQINKEFYVANLIKRIFLWQLRGQWGIGLGFLDARVIKEIIITKTDNEMWKVMFLILHFDWTVWYLGFWRAMEVHFDFVTNNKDITDWIYMWKPTKNFMSIKNNGLSILNYDSFLFLINSAICVQPWSTL